ncbi:MAG: hypothetical protein JRI22_16610 [Deltaproteobacteria bacterium]|nr:hypothetical protein [Deltaproteobacteria bacterium]
MKHKTVIASLATFVFLALLILPAEGRSLRLIRNYGNKVIKSLAKDPVILTAVQKSSPLDLSSQASAKLKEALKGKDEAIAIFVMDKNGVVVAASGHMEKTQYEG